MSGRRSAVEMTREKRDAAAVAMAEAWRMCGRIDPAKGYEYTQRAAAYEQALRFERIAEALIRRRKRVEVDA